MAAICKFIGSHKRREGRISALMDVSPTRRLQVVSLTISSSLLPPKPQTSAA
ncbi:hypothetical protein BDR22DRAFT_870147, partial [Usnea florida]